MPFCMTATRADILASITAANTGAGSVTHTMAIYTRSGSFISMVSSTTAAITFAANGASSDNNSYVGVSGVRWRNFDPSSWNFTPGEYWFACIASITGQTNSTGSVTIYGQSSFNVQGPPGGAAEPIGNYGVYRVATGDFPATMSMTDLLYGHTDSNNSSGSWVHRQPYFRMFGVQ